MHNNFSKSDFSDVKKLLNQTNPILTQSKKVGEFEKKWSKWLGVRYSTFVSSGSSANYISISILKVLNKNKYKNEIIVPTLTWISDISSILSGSNSCVSNLGTIANTAIDTKDRIPINR